METNGTLKRDIKQMMVENLMLQITTAEIGDDQALFGAGSLGLDSVDALQLVVALDKKYGLKIPTPERAREVLQSVATMAEGLFGGLLYASIKKKPFDPLAALFTPLLLMVGVSLARPEYRSCRVPTVAVKACAPASGPRMTPASAIPR